MGAINAYTARLAERVGFKALYISGGGVAASSLGVPDLGISTAKASSTRRIISIRKSSPSPMPSRSFSRTAQKPGKLKCNTL